MEAIVGRNVRRAFDAAKGVVVAVELGSGRLRLRLRLVLVLVVHVHVHVVDCGRVLERCGGRKGIC